MLLHIGIQAGVGDGNSFHLAKRERSFGAGEANHMQRN